MMRKRITQTFHKEMGNYHVIAIHTKELSFWDWLTSFFEWNSEVIDYEEIEGKKVYVSKDGADWEIMPPFKKVSKRKSAELSEMFLAERFQRKR